MVVLGVEPYKPPLFIYLPVGVYQNYIIYLQKVYTKQIKN